MKKRKIFIVFVASISLILMGCSQTQVESKSTTLPTLTQTLTPTITQIPSLTPTLAPPPTTRPTPELSDEARAYLEEALNVMEEYSIDKYNVDWDELRSRAFRAANGADTPSDTYYAIRLTLGKLGNGHSYLIIPSEANKLKEGSSSGDTDPIGKIIDGKFGYILVPAFNSTNDEVCTDFATKIQNLIQEVDQQNPCAWIVDLRENYGGTLMAMLAGIGPILGEGCFVSIVDPDGEEIQICYEDGVAYGGPLTFTSQVNGVAYETMEKGLPVAVLTSNDTASAGEVIVLAFRGRSNTQSFGYKTAGFSTANWIHEMSDGAFIVVTAATYADRNGQIYGDKISPDVKTEIIDEVPIEVKQWLLEQPSCKIEE